MKQRTCGDKLWEIILGKWTEVRGSTSLHLFFHRYFLRACCKMTQQPALTISATNKTHKCLISWTHGRSSLKVSKKLGLYSRGNRYYWRFSSSEARFGEVVWYRRASINEYKLKICKYSNRWFLHPNLDFAKKWEHWELCSVLQMKINSK